MLQNNTQFEGGFIVFGLHFVHVAKIPVNFSSTAKTFR